MSMWPLFALASTDAPPPFTVPCTCLSSKVPWKPLNSCELTRSAFRSRFRPCLAGSSRLILPALVPNLRYLPTCFTWAFRLPALVCASRLQFIFLRSIPPPDELVTSSPSILEARTPPPLVVAWILPFRSLSSKPPPEVRRLISPLQFSAVMPPPLVDRLMLSPESCTWIPPPEVVPRKKPETEKTTKPPPLVVKSSLPFKCSR